MPLSTRRILAAVVTASLLLVSPAAGHAAPRHKRKKKVNPALVYEAYAGAVGGDGWPVYYGHFAVPTCIVNAESHGLVHEDSEPDYSSGEYQIEPSTWRAYGGTRFTAYAYEATHNEQSWVASRIWNHGAGAGQWSTAAGCGY